MDNKAAHFEPMLIRFDSYEGRIAKGKIQTIRFRRPFEFNSLDQMFMIMDDVLDAVQFPREAGPLRHLKTEEGEQAYIFQKTDREDRMEDRYAPEGRGFSGQMTIILYRREHSSMQGTVQVDGNKTNFRSMLELLHMLYEYLENSFRKT